MQKKWLAILLALALAVSCLAAEPVSAAPEEFDPAQPIRYEMEDFGNDPDTWESDTGVTITTASADKVSGISGQEGHIKFDAGQERYVTLTLDHIPVSGNYQVSIRFRGLNTQNPNYVYLRDKNGTAFSERFNTTGRTGGNVGLVDNTYVEGSLMIEGVTYLEAGTDYLQIYSDGSRGGNLRADYLQIRLVGETNLTLTPAELYPIAKGVETPGNDENGTPWNYIKNYIYDFHDDPSVGRVAEFPIDQAPGVQLAPGSRYYLKIAFKPRTDNYSVLQLLCNGSEMEGAVLDERQSSQDGNLSYNNTYLQTRDPLAIVTADEDGRLNLGFQVTDIGGKGDFTILRMWLYQVPTLTQGTDGTPSVSAVTGDAVVRYEIQGTRISVLLDAGADLSAVPLTFTAGEGFTVRPADGTPLDLTQPAEIQVTGPGETETAYTVAGYTLDQASEADRAAAHAAEDALTALPDPVYRNHLAAAEAAVAAYGDLTELQRLLVSQSPAMMGLPDRIRDIRRHPIRVTCVGDSITEGIGASNNNLYSYPACLQQQLGREYQVFNAGVSGTCVIRDRALSSYPYVSTARYRAGLASSPDIVLILLGTNDASYQNWTRQTENGRTDYPDIFRADYEQLIREYQALESHPEIVLCLPMTTSDVNRQANNTNGTIPIIRALAEQYGLDLILTNELTDFRDASGNLGDEFFQFFPDGLHPCDASYPTVAGWMADRVKGIAAELAETRLSSLTLAEGTLDREFDPEVTEYTVTGGQPNAGAVSAAAANADASVRVEAEDHQVRITVESKTGFFGTVYTLTYQTQEETPPLQGDMNRDGTLNVADVVLLRRAILASETVESQPLGDLNGDGSLTVADVVLLRREILAQG